MNTAVTTQKGGNASPSLSFSADVDRVLCDLNKSFNPLHKDCLLGYHVSGARDGYVYLSIALPEGMIKVFVTLLESLSGFFRFIDIKGRTAVASAKAADPSEILRREKLQAEFKREVCEIFDGYIRKGIIVKEAVKLTNASLKAKNHPWATYEGVSTVLRAAGRFRKGVPAK